MHNFKYISEKETIRLLVGIIIIIIIILVVVGMDHKFKKKKKIGFCLFVIECFDYR